MSKSDETRMNSDCSTADPKDQNVCAHPDCSEELTQDNFCFGCNFFICDGHSTAGLMMGEHLVIEHWEEDEVED